MSTIDIPLPPSDYPTRSSGFTVEETQNIWEDAEYRSMSAHLDFVELLVSRVSLRPRRLVVTKSRRTSSNAERIVELKERTGLTWEQVAELFGVSKRAVMMWRSGNRMNAANEQRLSQFLHHLPEGPPAAVRDWLFTPGEGGLTPFDRAVGTPSRIERFEEWVDRQPTS